MPQKNGHQFGLRWHYLQFCIAPICTMHFDDECFISNAWYKCIVRLTYKSKIYYAIQQRKFSNTAKEFIVSIANF